MGSAPSVSCGRGAVYAIGGGVDAIALRRRGERMDRDKSAAGVDAEIASVITGIILLFSACNAYIKWKMERGRREKTNKTKEDK